MSFGKYPIGRCKLEITRRGNSELTPHGLLHGTRSCLGDGIPEFGSTKVDVVDTEQIHILDMPSKGSSPHSEVKIWCIDTWQTFI